MGKLIKQKRIIVSREYFFKGLLEKSDYEEKSKSVVSNVREKNNNANNNNHKFIE